jgi:hypothetical protein
VPQRRKPARKAWHQEPVSLFTALVALFTFVLCVVAGIQAWAFIQSERAFLSPSETNFVNWPLVERENPLLMYLDVRNSGKSTATIEELSLAIAHEIPAIPSYGGGTKIAFAPIVQGGTSRRTVGFETGWGGETINKINSGELKFYIFGRIKYWDDFSFGFWGPKETRFCFMYVVSKNTNRSIFQTCPDRAYTSAH